MTALPVMALVVSILGEFFSKNEQDELDEGDSERLFLQE